MSTAHTISPFFPTWDRSTLTAVFSGRAEARHVIDDLRAFGLRDDQIGVAMHDPHQQDKFIEDTGTHAADGAANRAVVKAPHGALYRLLGGLRANLLPGAPTVALAPAVAQAPAAPCGLLGALMRMQIAEGEARQQESGYRRGSVLLTAKVFEDVGEAQDIMRRHGGGMLDQPKH